MDTTLFPTLVLDALLAAAPAFGDAPLFPGLLASLAGRVPGIFFGLPLMALASLIFAATHHEDPAAIRLAAVHWMVWLGGMLGMVLAVVLLLGWMQ
jgi:hypothetical protein